MTRDLLHLHLRAAILWLLAGVAMGGFFGAPAGFEAMKRVGHDFEIVFASVHSHVNLLGGLTNALMAVTIGLLGHRLWSPRLARLQFWALNIGVLGMMLALFLGGLEGSRVYGAGRDGGELFGPNNAYLPYEALLGVLRLGFPFALLVGLSVLAFAANLWCSLGLPPRWAGLANRLLGMAPGLSRLLGLDRVPEAGPPEPHWGFLRAAVLWLVAGVSLGGILGSPPVFLWLREGGFDFGSLFVSLHMHMTVLGWLGNGTFGVVYLILDRPGGRGFPWARRHLLLYNLGLLGGLGVAAAAAWRGRGLYTSGANLETLYLPLQATVEVLRLAIPFAAAVGIALLLYLLGVRRALAGWEAPRTLRLLVGVSSLWLALGLLLEFLLNLDPLFFWQKRAGHEFELMLEAVKDHMTMVGGLWGLLAAALYAHLPGQPGESRWARFHLWGVTLGLAGFSAIYALAAYTGGQLFQTGANPYSPTREYIPYVEALGVLRLGVPLLVIMVFGLLCSMVNLWRASSNRPERRPRRGRRWPTTPRP